MLYDKKWDQKTEISPLSLDSFIAWLETKPADESYDWNDCKGNCLVDQYGMAVRGEAISHSGAALDAVFGSEIDDEWAYQRIYGTLPWTYGAALERAKSTRNKP
jgi:hypothetical protein